MNYPDQIESDEDVEWMEASEAESAIDYVYQVVTDTEPLDAYTLGAILAAAYYMPSTQSRYGAGVRDLWLGVVMEAAEKGRMDIVHAAEQAGLPMPDVFDIIGGGA